MREGCCDCARKHLAQALILNTERHLGYPEYKWLVIGHLAEAEAEILQFSVVIANIIREHRKNYESDNGFEIIFMELIEDISQLEDSLDGTPNPDPEPEPILNA